MLNIPFKTLQTHARQHGWQKLASTVAEHMTQPVAPPKAEQEMERIRENRQKNLELAQRLLEDVNRQVEALLDGSLKVQKVLSNGKIVEVEPGIKDRAALAGYARTAGEIAFRALGDIPLARAKESVPAQAALVEIHLPAAIALPRQLRGEPETQTLTLPNEQPKVIPVTLSPADETLARPPASESV
jgi:hypothetical protein